MSIIHNKIDHSITLYSTLAKKSKVVDELMKLLIKVTSIFVHGYKDGQYLHYNFNMFKPIAILS